MGKEDRPHAAKRTGTPVMPTSEEVIDELAEAYRARQETTGQMVSIADLARRIGMSRPGLTYRCERSSIFPIKGVDGKLYITREEAERVLGL